MFISEKKSGNESSSIIIDESVPSTSQISCFRPYYEDTFLVHSDDLQSLLDSVEQWLEKSDKDMEKATQIIRILIKLLKNTKEQNDVMSELNTLRRIDIDLMLDQTPNNHDSYSTS